MTCSTKIHLPPSLLNQLPPGGQLIGEDPAPQRTPPRDFPVGKTVMGWLYVHLSAVDTLPAVGQTQVRAALATLPPGFKPTLVRWKAGNPAISFMYSPDFDRSDEPILQASVKVVDNQPGKVLTAKGANPLIYHGKGFMVKNNYPGFNRQQSIQRFLDWKKQKLPAAQDLRRIGRKQYWEKEVLPFLKK